MHVLLVTKGHPFEKGPFFDLFDSLDGIEHTHVEQPAAQVFFDPELARDYDAFVCYDMPGIRFHPDGPEFLTPPQRFCERFLELLESGFGFVFLHHALASWPAWPEFAEIVGGRFLYLPGDVRGRSCPDSGYRHQVKHRVNVVDAAHPITAGLPKSFEITDELYLAQVFEDDVHPLLRSGYAFTRDNFYSAARAVRDGRMYDNSGWEHDDSSNLIGWVKRYRRSPICYLQCGDDPVAWASAEFRMLLGNAIRWVASEDAHAWAKAA